MLKKAIYVIIFVNLCTLFFSMKLDTHAEELDKNYQGNSSNDIVQPTGDKNVGYPQVCIRTNAKPQPLDFEELANKCDEVAAQFSTDEERARAVISYLNTIIGSGSLGHAWVIIFNSDKPNDYASYSFGAGIGYVSNHNPKVQDYYDLPDRPFIAQKAVKLPSNMDTNQIENNIIPKLIAESNEIGNIIGSKEDIVGNGTFTPLTTCTWFSGSLWNRIFGIKDQVQFTSIFPNSEVHAKRWGIPALSDIHEIANPGALSQGQTAAFPGFPFRC